MRKEFVNEIFVDPFSTNK